MAVELVAPAELPAPEAADEEVDVVVVGAGFSGLACAEALREHNLRVVVLEARDKVGGRISSDYVDVPGRGKFRVDSGGAYVGATQDRLLRVAKSVGVETYPVFQQGMHIQKITKGGSALRFTGTIPPMGIAAMLDANKLLCRWDELAFSLDPKAPWKHADAESLDATTVADWLRQNAWTTTANNTAQLIIQTVLCKEPSEVSLLYWLWYIRSGQGIMRLTTAENGAQDSKFKQGAHAVVERQAERLGGEVVRLNSPVAKLQNAEGCVVATTRAGHKIRASYAVIALAPSLYHKIDFSPPLPQMKAQLAANSPMGCIIKTNMFWDRPYWREKGLSGTFLSMDGPVCYCIDDCGPDGDKASIMGFVLAKHSAAWCEKSPAERQRAIAEQYAKMLGIPELAKPLTYFEKNWNAEEWSGGCYVGAMPPNVLSTYGKSLRERHGRVHFAGTETASKWVGYMDGAIEAGEREAREILMRFAATSERVTGDFSTFRLDEPQSQDMVPVNLNGGMFPRLPGPGGALAFLVVMIAAIAAAVFHFTRPEGSGGAAVAAVVYL